VTGITENKYKILNTYFNLAKGGLVEPLTCFDCGNEFTIWIPEDDIDLEKPVLKCWTCSSDTSPGSYVYDQIERAINAAVNNT
jgi:hypothetical protein